MEKKYPEIELHNTLGVCSAEEDTRLLAQTCAEAMSGGGSALDMGTGTGYVAIYLAQRGFKVDATDISERALALAHDNAQRNHVSVHIFKSHLFSGISASYDIIAFNPPMNPNETETTRLITSFLRRHRRLANVLIKVLDRFMDHSRLDFLVDFLAQARKHLTQNGVIVLAIAKPEIDALAKKLPDFEFGRRVNIERLPSHQIIVIKPGK